MKILALMALLAFFTDVCGDSCFNNSNSPSKQSVNGKFEDQRAKGSIALGYQVTRSCFS